MEVSVFVTSPCRSGRSTFLGSLLCFCGAVDQRQWGKLVETHGEDVAVPMAWYKRESRKQMAAVVNCLIFEKQSLNLSLLSCSDGSLRNSHRCLFNSHGVMLLVDLSRLGSRDYDGALTRIVQSVGAMHKEILLVVFLKEDAAGMLGRGESSKHLAHLMSRCGHRSVEWNPKHHHRCDKSFRDRIFAFLLLCRRLVPIPRDVIYMIIRWVASYDGATIPQAYWSHRSSERSKNEFVEALLQAFSAASSPRSHVPTGPFQMSCFRAHYIFGIGSVATGRVLSGECRRFCGSAPQLLLAGSYRRGWPDDGPFRPRYVGSMERRWQPIESTQTEALEALHLSAGGRLTWYRNGGVLLDKAAWRNVRVFAARVRVLKIARYSLRVGSCPDLFIHSMIYKVKVAKISDVDDPSSEEDIAPAGIVKMVTFRVLSPACYTLPHPSPFSYFVSYHERNAALIGATMQILEEQTE